MFPVELLESLHLSFLRLNPIEMGQKSPEDVIAKLSAVPEYAEAFQQVFGHPVNWDSNPLHFSPKPKYRLK